MRIEDLYTQALCFLAEQPGVTAEIVDKHIAAPPAGARPRSLAMITKTLLTSAQNAQMSPNVIGKALSGIRGNISPLGKILCDFDPKAAYTFVADLSDTEIFALIKPLLTRVPERTAIWLRYCRTLRSATAYMSKFADAAEFYAFVDSYERSDERRYELPAVFADAVDGIGFGLACDFMLGLGYSTFGKPDVHVKNILFDLGLLAAKGIAGRAADIESLRLLEKAARAAGTTVYAVDKVLWLIGSGDFYLAQPRFSIGRKRLEFKKWVSDQGAIA